MKSEVNEMKYEGKIDDDKFLASMSMKSSRQNEKEQSGVNL